MFLFLFDIESDLLFDCIIALLRFMLYIRLKYIFLSVFVLFKTLVITPKLNYIDHRIIEW